MQKPKGKNFEAEISYSLKALAGSRLPITYRNSNLPLPMCDHQVWYAGRGYLLEEKETHKDTFSFSAITDLERKAMESITRANCEGWVILKWVGPNHSRAFACLWTDWLEMEHGFGYDPTALRNKRGSGSFALVPDEHRPGFFIELERVERKDCMGNSLGKHWDLSPLFVGVA